MRLAFPRLAKPPIGTPLDSSSELQRGLFYFAPLWEGGGTTISDVVNGLTATIQGSAVWGPGSHSVGLNCNALVSYATSGSIPASLQYGWPITVAAGLRTGAGTPQNSVGFFAIGYSTGGGSPYIIVSLGYNAGSLALEFQYNQGGTWVHPSPAITLAANTDYVVSLTIMNGSQNLYVNGANVQALTAAASNPHWTSTSFIDLGGAAVAGLDGLRHALLGRRLEPRPIGGRACRRRPEHLANLQAGLARRYPRRQSVQPRTAPFPDRLRPNRLRPADLGGLVGQ